MRFNCGRWADREKLQSHFFLYRLVLVSGEGSGILEEYIFQVSTYVLSAERALRKSLIAFPLPVLAGAAGAGGELSGLLHLDQLQCGIHQI